MTWHLSHSGFATNSNNGWEKKSGSPRVGVWQSDYSDPDQGISFVKEPSNGAWYMVNIRTGKCYTADAIAHGKHVLLEPCRPGDRSQQFQLHKIATIAQGLLHVRFTIPGTNLCLHNSQLKNYGALGMINCDNSLNQLWEMKFLHDYTATNVVFNGGTVPPHLSTPPSSNTGGGSDSLPHYGATDTTPRTGGGGILIGGLLYAIENGFITVDNTLIGIKKAMQLGEYLDNAIVTKGEKDLRKPVKDDQYGKHINYTAYWGYYSRYEGAYLNAIIRDLETNLAVNAAGAQVLVSGLLLVPGGQIPALIVEGFTVVGTGVNYKLIVNELKTCSDTTNRAYIRYHLISGSWINSIASFPVQGINAFAYVPTVSCN